MNKLLEKLKEKVPGVKYILISMAVCTAIWAIILTKTYLEVAKMRKLAIAEMEQAKLNEEESLKAERLAAADGAKFDLKTHEMMAMYFLDKKQYAQAIPHFKRFLNIEDEQSVLDNPSNFMLLADAYIKSRRAREALSLLAQIKKVLGSDPAILLKEGEAYMILGENEKAIELIRSSIKADSTNSTAFSQLARAISYVDPLSTEIEKFFAKSVELEPRNIESRYQFGVYLEKNARYNDAIREFKNILEVEPFNTLALGRLGMLYFYIGD
ncbi:MAG: tetratricopeptide repeat protein, partial [Fibrobacteres bacterium]|nr:tetratricopeptide repeat protein [Fibrobacterota bacterium]